ncbi:hypothetical protein E3T43_07235 [Cryobacterium sp. Hh7]|uniref:hypothetical protein n=1 Tax=Cryobacterium sp. Hh7 TaxID=1259159 RepID=UPI00106DA04A|nr:hypothetical protein [Cryobacterium sp. Hh7]TFD58034.1 hypothetical protein E3T43_07235 [Cryobacterium sp. Hh7]
MATAKTAPTPGPKPDFLVVENHLKCQTGDGEVSLDLRISLEKLELFMNMEDIEPKALPRHILNDIVNAEDKARLEGLTDGVEAYKIIMEFAKAIGGRLGMGLGESVPSIASSESTERPSDTTSDTDSE